MAARSSVANLHSFGEKPSFVPVVSVQWSIYLVATAFSVDTVVTARHSVTSPFPSLPPPATLHQATAAIRPPGAKRGHSNLETTCFFLLHFTIKFFLPPKILKGPNSLKLLDQWQQLVALGAPSPCRTPELIVPWLRFQWPFFQYRELEWYLLIKMSANKNVFLLFLKLFILFYYAYFVYIL